MDDLGHVLADLPVGLTFRKVALTGINGEDDEDFELSDSDRDSIVEHVKEIISNDLLVDLDLIECEFAGRKVQYRKANNSFWLPLRISIKGPSDVLSEFALTYILDILRDEKNMKSTVTHVKSLDYNAFRTAVVSVNPYDWEELLKELTDHRMQLIFSNMLMGYRFTDKMRSKIIKFVEDQIEKSLDESLELIEVVYGGRVIRYGEDRSRFLQQFTETFDTKILPIMVTVNGQVEVSELATLYIMEAIQNRMQQIESFIKSLDRDAFKDALIELELFDPNDVPDGDHEYPVQLIFSNLPPGNKLPENDQEYVISFLENRLYDDLPDLLQLQEVEYAGTLQTNTRLLQLGGAPPSALPLLIGVQGPADVSDDVLPYLLQSIQDDIRDLEDSLGSMNRDMYRNVRIAVDTYDTNDLLPEEKTRTIVFLEEEQTASPMPWWAWFLIAMLILLCCCCCTWFCIAGVFQYRKRKSSKDIKDEEEIIFKKVIEVEEAPIHVKKKKKHHKKRKKRSKRSKELASVPREVVQEVDTQDRMVLMPYGDDRTLAVESAITMFDIDPQESNHLQSRHLALPPPTEEPLLLHAETHGGMEPLYITAEQSHQRRTAALSDASTSKASALFGYPAANFTHQRGAANPPPPEESVLLITEEPPGVYGSEPSVVQSATAQPVYTTNHQPPRRISVAMSDASASQYPYRGNFQQQQLPDESVAKGVSQGARSVAYSNITEPPRPGAAHLAQDPRGGYSFRQSKPVNMQQDPMGATPHHQSSMFATFDHPSFATKKGSRSAMNAQSLGGSSHRRKYGVDKYSRLQSGGVTSEDGDSYGTHHIT